MGNFQKAIDALSPAPRAPYSDETLSALRAKHPVGPPVVASPHDGVSLIAEEHLVRRCIHSFRAGSSPGNLGLRAEHLKVAIKFHSQSSLLTTLTSFINKYLSGSLNSLLAPYIGSASLSALTKKDNGVRPLACGNVFRRLASKCVCFMLKPQLEEFFVPLQYGVGSPRGIESLVHFSRHLWDSSIIDPTCEESGFLKVDFENAFNNVSRQAIYDQLVLHFPAVVPYFLFNYASPSNLYYGSHVLPSSNGVQQGDPLGPFLFSLVLQTLIQGFETLLNAFSKKSGKFLLFLFFFSYAKSKN
jgi:hypothetical protein